MDIPVTWVGDSSSCWYSMEYDAGSLVFIPTAPSTGPNWGRMDDGWSPLRSANNMSIVVLFSLNRSMAEFVRLSILYFKWRMFSWTSPSFSLSQRDSNSSLNFSMSPPAVQYHMLNLPSSAQTLSHSQSSISHSIFAYPFLPPKWTESALWSTSRFAEPDHLGWSGEGLLEGSSMLVWCDLAQEWSAICWWPRIG